MDVYSSKVSYAAEELTKFLDGIQLPKLEGANRKQLNAPITLEKLQTTMVTFPNSKAPGNYGLPIEVCKKFGDIFLPELCQSIIDAHEQGTPLSSMYEGFCLV